jgi:tetratricopeptide (TPR) repeat protein
VLTPEQKSVVGYSQGPGLAWSFIVAVLTALLYLPSLNGTFVYDDQMDVVENPAVHTLSDAPDYLSLSAMRQGLYDAVRPVYVVSIMVEWALWGAKPFGYHLTNLVLHVLNALLLFLWVRHLLILSGPGREKWAAPCAAAGALLFSLHPVASEAVCAVTFRKDLLVAFFTLLGLNGLTRFSGRGGREDWLFGAGITFAFLLAVGSKENGIAGPYLAILYWALFRRGSGQKAWAPLLGTVFLLVHAFILLRLTVPHNTDTITPQYLGGSFIRVLLRQPRIWAYQLSQIFLPTRARFCADPFQLALDGFSRAGGIAVTLAAAVAAVWIGRKDKVALFGLALYGLALLPESNLVPIPQAMADRFLYLPLTSLGIVASAVLLRWLPALDLNARVASVALGLVVLAGLGMQTVERQKAWHDDLSLWTDTLAKNPKSLNALMGYAGALYVKGDAAGAATAYTQLNEITRGQLPDAWGGLAASLDAMGRTKDADKAFAQLISMDPRYLTPEQYGQRTLRLSAQDVADFQRLAKRYKGKG